ncbi:uncharacterized protein LOC144437379 [Glandiceps talaboti]
MDPSQIQRLREEQQKVIDDCNQRIQQWEKFSTDYEALHDRLQTLPDKVSHDIMVPFGSLAFMPGKMVHTNEILVLLGDNWFAERSAKQACEIVQRRKGYVDDNLKKVIEEKKLIESRVGFTDEITKEVGAQGVVDINEPYDEVQERKWRENRRKQFQQKATEKAKEKEEKRIQEERKKLKEAEEDEERMRQETVARRHKITEEELWARLDALEAEEEELDELAKLSDFNESEEEEQEEDMNNCRIPRPNSLPQREERQRKHVKWKDEPEVIGESDDDADDINKTILFTHTKIPSLTSIDEDSEEENDDKSTPEDSPRLESPRDIYKHFGNKMREEEEEGVVVQSVKEVIKHNVSPKSILKHSTGVTSSKMQKKEKMPMRPVMSAPMTAFSGTIVERNKPRSLATLPEEPSVLQDNAPPKRVSKFKAARQKAI